MDIKALADKYIPADEGRTVLKKNGETPDIIAEVIAAFKDSRGQLRQFAPHLKAATLRQTLRNVWNFWKYQITYRIDPDGGQWVQEPRALWARKVGDCKSLSVAVMCTLYELGIQASFRFTNYNNAINYPTHVYVVVLNNGHEIPVDCVWREFGNEKPYNLKWDYNMTSIYRVSGLENNGSIAGRKSRRMKAANLLTGGAASLLKNSKASDFFIPGSRILRKMFGRKKKRRVGDISGIRGVLEIPEGASHEVVGLLLDKQYLEMQQIKNAQVHGIGSTQDRAYEMDIMAHHNAVAELMELPQRRIVGYGKAIHPHDMEDGLNGIAGKKGKARKLKKAMKANDGKGVSKRQARMLRKAGVAVKKRKESLLKRVGKGLKKIVKAPARLAIRSQLPKAAPFFLYTFITDERVLAKLPEQVAIKRQKALSYKDIIVKKLEMPEANFEKAVRNGIMNTFAKTPEEVLAKWMADANFKVGVLPIVAAAFGALKGLLKLMVGKAAANLKADMEQYAPAPEDWGAIPQDQKEDLANQVRNQESNIDPAYRPQTEQDFFDSNSPGLDTPDQALNIKRGDDSEDTTLPKNLTTTVPGDESNIVKPNDDDQPGEKGNNTMLWLGLAAVAVIGLSSVGGGKKSKRA